MRNSYKVLSVFWMMLVPVMLTAYSQEDNWAPVDYDIQLDTIRSGFDKETCWVHPRAGTIPGETPIVVMTMQKLLLSGSDVFYALNEMRTDDLGKTWSGPVEHDTLSRRQKRWWR